MQSGIPGTAQQPRQELQKEPQQPQKEKPPAATAAPTTLLQEEAAAPPAAGEPGQLPRQVWGPPKQPKLEISKEKPTQENLASYLATFEKPTVPWFDWSIDWSAWNKSLAQATRRAEQYKKDV